MNDDRAAKIILCVLIVACWLIGAVGVLIHAR